MGSSIFLAPPGTLWAGFLLVTNMPGCHMRRVRGSVRAGTEEAVVIVGIDVMDLHHRHQMPFSRKRRPACFVQLR